MFFDNSLKRQSFNKKKKKKKAIFPKTQVISMLFYIQVHKLKKKKKTKLSTHLQNVTEHEVCSFYIISLIGKVSPHFPVPLD